MKAIKTNQLWNKNNFQKVLLAALSVAIWSCQGRQPSDEGTGPSSGKQNLSLPVEAWDHEVERYNDTVTVLSKVLTDQGRQESEKQTRETSLEPINLPTNYNVNAFTVRSRGNVRTRSSVFIAPKLYFYQKSDGANVVVKRDGDRVIIPLHAILVDGLSEYIPKPNGIDKVRLPDSYRVNISDVKSALIERGYDNDTSVGPLDGCAKEFTLTVSGTTYNVTPPSVRNSDYCEINRPFTLNLVVPAEKADSIINDALYMNEIDAAAAFQVAVGFIDSDMRIQLDRSKIYEKLEMSLQMQRPPYFKGDIQAKLKSIIQKEMMNVFIKGDRSDVIMQLVQMAYDSFVVPYELKATPDQGVPDCSDTVACLSINYEKNSEYRSLEVGYQQYSTTLTEKTITSFAKPQQILFPEVAFSSENDQQGEYIDNLNSRMNERVLAVTVMSGSVIELMMNGFIHEIDNTELALGVEDWNRCGSYDWTKRCEWHEYFRKVTRSYAGVSFSEFKEFAGNILGNPMRELKLKFLKADGSDVICSLSQMDVSANGNKFVVKIENTATCPIFSDNRDKKEKVSVNFINHLRDPNQLRALNDRGAFKYEEVVNKIDGEPTADTTLMGGTRSILPVQLDRSIRLKIKVLIRKYNIE